MKRLFTLLALLTLLSVVQAQTLLNEGFDNGIPESWTIFDDGHTPHNHALAQPWTLSEDYGSPAPAVLSASWFTVEVQADRWLVTDSVYIPDSGYVFSVEAAAYELAYADGFAVKVSLNGRASRNVFDSYNLISVSACTGTLDAYTASLDAYIGHWVHFAIIQNSFSKNFLIVDNVKVYKPEQDALAIARIEVPSNLALHDTLQPKVTIWNSGLNTLSSLQIDYTLEGDTVHAVYEHVEIFPDGSYEFTLPPYVVDSTGDKEVTLHAYLPNGVADNEADNYQSASLFVYDASLTAPHKTLIEEFSDIESGYCVPVHRHICNAVDDDGNSIHLVHHATGDTLTVAGSQQLFEAYADSESVVPLVMVDRRAMGDHGLLYTPGSTLSVSNDIEEAAQQPCFSSIALNYVQYNDASRQISGNVLGRITFPQQRAHARLALYLVEDSLFTRQRDYEEGNPGDGYYIDFRQMGVVRSLLTDPFGEPLTYDSIGTFVFPLQATIPANYRAWRCKVVAVLYHYDSNDVRSSYVLNSNETGHFSSPYIGIPEVGEEVTLQLYPNPTQDQVWVSSESEISELALYDAAGHLLQQHRAAMGNRVTLHLAALPAGIYLVEIHTAQGTCVEKIVKR